MAKYQDLGDGLYGLDLPMGRAVIRSDDDSLRSYGHEPMTLDQPVAMQDPGALSEGATAEEAPLTQGQAAVAAAVQGGGGQAAKPGPPPQRFDFTGVPSGVPRPSGMPRMGKTVPTDPATGQPLPPGAPPGAGTKGERVGIPAGGGAPAQGGERPPIWNDEELGALAQVGKEAMRGGGYSPGGMQLAGRTIKGKVLPEGTAQALASEAARPDPAQPAMQKVGYSQVLGNEAQADALRDWGEEEQMFLQEDRFKRAALDREITAKENAAQQAWQEAGKVPSVDAERHWNNKTTLGKILASVLLGLGWIVAAKTGVNPAQQAFNKANEDDMAAQKDAYERAAAKGKAADNAYAREVDRWGKPELAEQAFRLRGEKIFDAMVKERALRTQNPEIMARIELWSAERDDQRQRQWGALLSQMAPSVEETFKYRAPSGGGGSLAKAIKAQRNTAEDLRVLRGEAPIPTRGAGGVGEQRQREHDQGTTVRLPDGSLGRVGSKTQKVALDDVFAHKADLDKKVARFRALVKEREAGKIDPLSFAARVAGLGADIATGLKQQKALGAWDKGAQEITSRMSGIPTSRAQAVAMQAVPYWQKMTEATLDEMQRSLGALQQEVIRQTVSRDAEATTPVLGAEPE